MTASGPIAAWQVLVHDRPEPDRQTLKLISYDKNERIAPDKNTTKRRGDFSAANASS